VPGCIGEGRVGEEAGDGGADGLCGRLSSGELDASAHGRDGVGVDELVRALRQAELGEAMAQRREDGS
jgi:hypothetical protein